MTRPSPLPLGRDPSGRFLPFVIAVLVYLSALALVVLMVLSQGTREWRAEAAGTLTVQIVPAAAEGAETVAKRVEAAVEVLRATAGVARVEALSDAEARALLSPWLGDGALAEALPLPRVIDVRLDDRAPPDIAMLAARLDDVAGAELTDHGAWLARLLELAGVIEGLALAITALIALTAIATVVFTTRTGLVLHAEVIELLHLMGAQDRYIAGLFQRATLWRALKGATFGALAAAMTTAGLGLVVARVEPTLLPRLEIAPSQWAALAALAVAAALVAMLTARWTVLRRLRRLL